MSNMSHLVLFPAHDRTETLLLNLRRDGTHAVEGRRGHSLQGFLCDGTMLSVKEVEEEPQRLALSVPITGTTTEQIEHAPVRRAVCLGPRWQTVWDTASDLPCVTIHRSGGSARLVVDQDGLVRNQSYWKGKPIRLVGFAASLDSRVLALDVQDLFEDPSRCEGLFPVMADWSGTVNVYHDAARAQSLDQRRGS